MSSEAFWEVPGAGAANGAADGSGRAADLLVISRPWGRNAAEESSDENVSPGTAATALVIAVLCISRLGPLMKIWLRQKTKPPKRDTVT